MTDTTLIPAAPALPDNAPTIYEMWDYTNSDKPVITSTVTLSVRDADYVSEDAVYAVERGAAAWYRSDQTLKLADFEFGPHLFVSQAGNTTSGAAPLQEVLIGCAKRGTWTSYPAANTYDKHTTIVFPPPFKIVAKDRNGNIVHTFEMHDGLPINDPSLHQGFPTATQPERPKFDCAMTLLWWSERPRQSASLASMYAGMTDAGRRPSAAKSHFSVLSCEPEITGGYSRSSLNSLGSIYASLEWAQCNGAHWPDPAEADPWLGYTDLNYEGHSAYMGPYVMGWNYEAGSRTSHNWYSAPGGPRFDRAPFPSQFALWMTDPTGHRPQNKLAYAEIAYNFALAYGNHSNHWMTDPSKLHWCDDADLLNSSKYFIGNYYGDGAGRGPNAIEINGNQRDGTGPQHYDVNGDMPFHGWARDALHDYASAAHAAIAMQSPMMAILSKWDTATAFMLHGPADHSGIGGSYLVRDMAWEWLHHVLARKVAADHPLGFKRQDIEDRFCAHLEAIHRDIVTPVMTGARPDGMYEYFEGLVRFGQPLTQENGSWAFHGGGLAFYIGGVLIYMKQSGMWQAIQQRGGKAKEALDFTVRNYCQYAFGIFAQTRATMWSNPNYPQDMIFADGTGIPKDWAEFSARIETDGSDFNGDANGVCRGGDRDVSVHPVIQFIYAMRDYFPEIDHPLKAAAIAKLDFYLQRQTDYVASKAGDNGAQRDADHIFRYPGLSPVKAPLVLGPGDPVTLPRPEAVPAKVIVPAWTPQADTVGGAWVAIGTEGDRLTVDPDTRVCYGSGKQWLVTTQSGTFDANNGFFGSDPAPGVHKTVMKFVPTAAPAPAPDPIPVPPVVEPAPTPTPEPIPAPAPAPIPEPVPVPALTPAPDPVPAVDPVPVPTPDPAPIPLPDPLPVPDPVPTPAPTPAPDPQAKYKLPFFKAVAGAIAFLETCGYNVTKK